MNRISIRSASQFFAGVAFFALATTAMAADFGGAYVGFNVGVGRNDASVTHSLEGTNCNTAANCVRQAAAVSGLPGGVTDTAFTAGGQAGYNWVRGNTVFGLEFDANYMANNKGQTTGPSTFVFNVGGPNKRLTSTDSIDSGMLFTIRPRIGFKASDSTLVYATGGLAFAQAPKVTNQLTIFNIQNNFTQYSFNSSGTKQLATGWVLGGGVEYAWSNNMSVRAEYQHVDIGYPTVRTANVANGNGSAEGVGSTLSLDSRGRMDILRVGFNWKF